MDWTSFLRRIILNLKLDLGKAGNLFDCDGTSTTRIITWSFKIQMKEEMVNDVKVLSHRIHMEPELKRLHQGMLERAMRIFFLQLCFSERYT